MDYSKINTHVAFGKPTIACSDSQLYYDGYQQQDDPIYKRDCKWFARHPRQQRFIRPALGDEFNVANEHLDYFGVRVVPPMLWVSVERRLGGRLHQVQPVYRGSCFWDIDAAGNMVPDDEHDDEGNTTANDLLYRFHLSKGAHPGEMYVHAAKVAEVLLAIAALSSGPGGKVN